jgi:hypothetical protein
MPEAKARNNLITSAYGICAHAKGAIKTCMDWDFGVVLKINNPDLKKEWW